jgi:hypothetical protein
MSQVSRFAYLFKQWKDSKQAWSEMQAEMQERFRAGNPLDSTGAWRSYFAWYAANADRYIQEFNTRQDALLAEFPLTEWGNSVTLPDHGGPGDPFQ